MNPNRPTFAIDQLYGFIMERLATHQKFMHPLGTLLTLFIGCHVTQQGRAYQSFAVIPEETNGSCIAINNHSIIGTD